MNSPVSLFITPELFPETPGGCGVLINHLIDTLSRDGIRTAILLDAPQPVCDRVEARLSPNGVKLHRMASNAVDHNHEVAWGFFAHAQSGVRTAEALNTLLRIERFDLIEFYDWAGPLASYMPWRALHTGPHPVLAVRLHLMLEQLEHHGVGVLSREKLLSDAMERASLFWSETIVAPSRTYGNFVAAEYGIPAIRVAVSRPPCPGLGPSATRERIDIAFIGRMFEHKGASDCVRAGVRFLRERPAFAGTIQLVGYASPQTPIGADFADYLRTLIPQELRNRFAFRGSVSHSRLAEILQASQFAVFPTHAESFCYAAHESFMAGVPVILRELPAFTEFFEPGKHCLMYSGGAFELAAAMMQLWDNPNIAAEKSSESNLPLESNGDETALYASPVALHRFGTGARTRPPTLAVVVLCEHDAQESAASIRVAWKLRADTRVILARRLPSGTDGVLFLGEPTRFEDDNGPVDAHSKLGTESLAVLHRRDTPDQDWFDVCRQLLASDPRVAFGATWSRIAADQPRPEWFDVLPGLFPFDMVDWLPRCIVPIDPTDTLESVFDPMCGSLGVMARIWQDFPSRRGLILPRAKVTPMLPMAVKREDRWRRALITRWGGGLSLQLSGVSGFLASELDGLKAVRADRAAASSSNSAHPPTFLERVRQTLRRLVLRPRT